MTEMVDRLTRYAVSCAKAFERDAETILAPDSPYGHENYKYAAHVFLALYRHEHPQNPYFARPEALEWCRHLADGWVSEWEATRQRFAEWPPLVVCRALDLAGDELGDDRRARWTAFVEDFVREDLPKPFFFAAPNHEAWRLAVTALAGRVLRRPEWIETAEFQMLRLIRYQTPEGFWEEGRHHGPSMKYNSLQLGAMAVVAEETGNEHIRAAAARLADFIARWSFPDGVTVGAFDGRQSTSPGYFGLLVPGLELAGCGLTHAERILRFWDRARWLDAARIGPSNWYAHFGMPFAAESLLYYARRAVGDRPPEATLPMDRDGAVLENHSPLFEGVLRRQGPWCVALSGQLSDVPKDTLFIYRLERQNRIEVWHERGSVVLGGGHNTVTAEHPLYNVWVDTGFEASGDEDYAGKEKGDVGSPAMTARRAKYYPRAAWTGVDGDTSWLELDFAHAAVRFEIEPDADDLEIRYRYETMGVRELRLALSLVLWRSGARCLVDGSPLDGPREGQEPALAEARKEVAVETPLFGTRTVLALPEDGRTRVRFPLWPLRSYQPLFPPDQERFESFYAMAQVETVFENPSRSGHGRWVLAVDASPGNSL